MVLSYGALGLFAGIRLAQCSYFLQSSWYSRSVRLLDSRNSLFVFVIIPLRYSFPYLVTVCGTIGLRAHITLLQTRGIVVPNRSALVYALDISQITNLVLTLLTNLLSTSIVAYKAWYGLYPTLLHSHLFNDLFIGNTEKL